MEDLTAAGQGYPWTGPEWNVWDDPVVAQPTVPRPPWWRWRARRRWALEAAAITALVNAWWNSLPDKDKLSFLPGRHVGTDDLYEAYLKEGLRWSGS